MKRQKFYQQYLNIPYKHLGRDRKGLDCWGLPILYYREVLNKELKDWYYDSDWHTKGENHFLENRESFHFEEVTTPALHDIVLFCMDITSNVPSHAGIIVEVPDVVLTAGKKGVHLMSLNAGVVRRRIEGFYRLCQN